MESLNVLSTNAVPTIETSNRGALADWAGMVASIGCAIHCAAMPLVLAYLPTFGLGWLAGEGFHRWMAVVCFLFAAAAFVPGWRKHRSFLPAVWAAMGLALLTMAAFGMEDSCCASCAPSESVASTTTDADCATCATNEHAVGESNEGDGTTVAGFSLTPFVTPLGGLLLVVGHILNHRKSCRCQGNTCCLGDEEARGTTQ